MSSPGIYRYKEIIKPDLMNHLVFNNVDGDHNMVDNSTDHSTNIGAQAGTKTKNIGSNAGATNIGPGAGGINSGHSAGSINYTGKVNKGGPIPIKRNDQYSYLPPVNGITDIDSYTSNHNQVLPYDSPSWVDNNTDFDQTDGFNGYAYGQGNPSYDYDQYSGAKYYHDTKPDQQEVLSYYTLENIDGQGDSLVIWLPQDD